MSVGLAVKTALATSDNMGSNPLQTSMQGVFSYICNRTPIGL